MKIRSKKGEAFIFAVAIGALALIALPFMTPRFRVKKAVEKCGGGVFCEEKVAGMSKAEILESIKDK